MPLYSFLVKKNFYKLFVMGKLDTVPFLQNLTDLDSLTPSEQIRKRRHDDSPRDLGRSFQLVGDIRHL